jgi:hypothetical protein
VSILNLKKKLSSRPERSVVEGPAVSLPISATAGA